MSSSKHWGLRNIFLPVSLNQFKKLATQFQKAVECEFGTGVQLKLIALSQTPVFFTTENDMSESYRLSNERNTFLRAQSLDALTPEAWKQAAYVKIILRPIDDSKAPSCAFATMEGKGSAPRKVNFYAQPTNEASAQALSKNNPFMRLDDSFDTNGIILRPPPLYTPY